jgi:hypothetical protein
MAGENQNDNHKGDIAKSEQQKDDHHKETAPHIETAPPPGRGVLGAIGAVWNAVMRGGELQAAFRMGVDELGQALKAFPDSIHAHAEPGGMFEPLHSDVAAARDQYAPRESRPTPGDIARGRNFTAAEREEGSVHGKGNVQTAQADIPKPGGFLEKELERRENEENDGYGRGRGRSLPDEQRDQENDQGRGR